MSSYVVVFINRVNVIESGASKIRRRVVDAPFVARGATGRVPVVFWRRGPRPGKGRNSRTRRSSSPAAGPAAAAALLTTSAAAMTTVAPGYEQYQKSLLEVPWPHAEYGEASSDDLSSEWDSDVPEPPPNSKVNQYLTSVIIITIIIAIMLPLRVMQK